MNEHGLTKENLLAALPIVLREDPSVSALAEAAAELLAKRPEELERLKIYPAIGRLEEPLLDVLAHDFKVDWWDPDYSLEEKRRTLKDSWRVHMLLGTKAAVVTAISAIYPDTTLQEWFEYGGKPYHFRLYVNISNEAESPDRSRMNRVLSRVMFYKNLRSHLDGAEYVVRPEEPVELHGGACLAGGALTVLAVSRALAEVELPHGTAKALGGAAAAGVSLRVEGTVTVDPDRLGSLYLSPLQAGAALSAAGAMGGAHQTILVEVFVHGKI